MNKKSLANALAMAFIASPAWAADLPPLPIWTGFYAGLNAGYGWGTTNGVATTAAPLVDNIVIDPAWGTPFGFTTAASSGSASVHQGGFIGGGQFGYNYQLPSKFVLGLEADFQGSVIQGKGSYAGFAQFGPDLSALIDTAFGAGTIQARLSWLGTVRGRLGYLVMPELLAYATGGLAYGGVQASAVHSVTFVDSFPTLFPPLGGAGHSSGTRVGWTVGGGAEWMIAPNWSLKAEALYYDLGTAYFASSAVGAVDPDGTNLIGGVPGAIVFLNRPTTRVRYNGIIARAGINYHFNWGAPPVATHF